MSSFNPSGLDADPCVIVIFGASGDLTKRKLIPALYDLDRQGRLPKGVCILGTSRTDKTDDAWRAELTPWAKDHSANFDEAEIARNPFFCPDAAAAKRWEEKVDAARKAGSSLGAIVECVATGVPAGWGAPVYAKLDGDLAVAAERLAHAQIGRAHV